MCVCMCDKCNLLSMYIVTYIFRADPLVLENQLVCCSLRKPNCPT